MNRRAVAAQARVETLLTVRRGESLLVTLGIPAGVLLFFGTVDVVDTGPGDRIDFVAPGVLALAVMSTAMVSLGIATGFERRYGVLKRLGPTPLGRSGLLVAKTLTVLGLEVVQALILALVALALGWSPDGGGAAAVGIMALGTVAFAGLGLLMAGSLRAEATLALANGLYILLLLTGGMAFPLSELPRALEVAARAFPAAPLAGCLRGALDGSGVPGGELAVLAAWALAAPVLAARAFRWEE